MSTSWTSAVIACGPLLMLLASLTSLAPGGAEGKRVVMMPNPLTSHTKYHTNVARALHARGHEVWVTMPDYLVRKGQLDVSNFTVIQYSISVNVEEKAMFSSRDSYFNGENEDLLMLIGLINAYCDDMLRNETLFRYLRDVVAPDLVVVDNLPQVKMLAVLPYRLNVPFAFLGSIYQPLDQRIPFSPAVLPLPLFKVSDHHSFFQRVLNTLLVIGWSLADPFLDTHAVARYAPERPYIAADLLIAHAEIWLIEIDHILDYPRPTMPNIKLIGGTATGPAKPLPSYLQKFMDEATEGVVLVTFGSYVLDIPQEVSDKLWEVFRRLPYRVVFRSSLPSPNSARILTSPWVPQNDILGHPNTMAFVSHCGKNGQYEALYHAVPVVATPMFGDQRYNAERMRVKGFAELVDVRTASVEEIVDTILLVAGSTKYKSAISAASRLFRQEYNLPMNEAAFWLDHVMEYGGAYMRSSGHDMPLYQFMLIDVIAFLVTCCLLALALVSALLVIVCRYLCKKERRRYVLTLVVEEESLSKHSKKIHRLTKKFIRASKKSFLGLCKLFVVIGYTERDQERTYAQQERQV